MKTIRLFLLIKSKIGFTLLLFYIDGIEKGAYAWIHRVLQIPNLKNHFEIHCRIKWRKVLDTTLFLVIVVVVNIMFACLNLTCLAFSA